MIIPDVNILLHAYNADSKHHEITRNWWEECLNRDRPVGLAWISALGFLRIVTSRRVLARPVSAADAISIVRTWLANPHVHVIQPGEQHAEILFRLLGELETAANLTTDAHLAALAIEYQAEIVTADNDFARFPGLRWFNPVSTGSRGRRPSR